MMIDAIKALEQKLRTTGRFDEADDVREVSASFTDDLGPFASRRLFREKRMCVGANGSSAYLYRVRPVTVPGPDPILWPEMTSWVPDGVVEFAHVPAVA